MLDERFIDRNIAELSMHFDKIRGANVNIARIMPDYIDGLKLVARRLLYIMYLEEGGKTFRKVATITGEVTGKLHMHGQSSVYSCLVGLAQSWNNNIPVIEPRGNYGSVSGDSAAADRYIKARLSQFAQDCYFADWKESAVDMILGADGKTMEPLYLPARYPVVLLNAVTGIGFGMSTNICPYNFKELVETTIKLMNDPEAKVILIPDSPTGADVIAGNFQKIIDMGNGVYSMRCKYKILSEDNIIKIINLPYQVTVNAIRERIADIKKSGGLPELTEMEDFSGSDVDLRLTIRSDVNPYKFMKKLIDEIPGLEKSYPVNISVTNDYSTHDLSVKSLLLEWIKYRREQKRIVVIHKRTDILSAQRANDVKIFLLSENRLDDTINLFRTSRNKKEIEKRLLEVYKDSLIKMDSIQASILADMKMYELSIETHEACIKLKEQLKEKMKEVEDILNNPNGIDELIVAELRDGAKKYGTPRRSNVVPYKISIDTEIAGVCILQLSSDGNILRRKATNVDEEPVPLDTNGYSVKVDNDSGFIAIDEYGYYAYIKVKEIPVNQEVPLNRYIKGTLSSIVALLPYDPTITRHCTLISQKGVLKKLSIGDMKASKKPCIEMEEDDKLVSGVITTPKTTKDILVYTNNGRGQRLDPNNIRTTSISAKGGIGFKMLSDERIIGCYTINSQNEYLLYVSIKGKMRLNLTKYLPQRTSKHDKLVNLINLPDRDQLTRVIGCNKLDQVQVFFNDGDSEIISMDKIPEGTMSTEPKKMTKKNAVSSSIVKVKLL